MSAAHCNACGHEHRGAELAYICVGCPCEERPGFEAGEAAAVELESEEATREDELDDVLRLLRRHDADQVRGITPPTMSELIGALERGEHHR